MPFGFRKDPEPVGDQSDNKADDGKGDGKFKPNERRDAIRKLEGYKEDKSN